MAYLDKRQVAETLSSKQPMQTIVEMPPEQALVRLVLRAVRLFIVNPVNFYLVTPQAEKNVMMALPMVPRVDVVTAVFGTR